MQGENVVSDRASNESAFESLKVKLSVTDYSTRSNHVPWVQPKKLSLNSSLEHTKKKPTSSVNVTAELNLEEQKTLQLNMRKISEIYENRRNPSVVSEIPIQDAAISAANKDIRNRSQVSFDN